MVTPEQLPSPRRPHLYGMIPEDLVKHLTGVGVRIDLSLARRILGRTISEGHTDFRVRGLSRLVRRELEFHTTQQPLTIVERAVSPEDGFVKYLLQSRDGALFEAVRIPLHKTGRYSVCLSSQVGCAMRCAFCATAQLGFERNLEAWEIVGAFLAVRSDTERVDELGIVHRLTGAVFMGQGEPLLNYDNVIQASRVLSHPVGGRISATAISISTVGILPQIRRYTREGHPYRLIISLTSAIEERRRELLPGVGGTSLSDLAQALREHAVAVNDRVTVAWVLLAGVNTGEDEAMALRALLEDIPIRFNLIDLNTTSECRFTRAGAEERSAFIDLLQPLGVPIVRRYSGGASQHAACGMLRNMRTHRVSWNQ